MPPQPQPGPSFRERYAFAQWLIQFPALTVLVFLRRDLGYRLLNPRWLIGVTAFLLAVTTLLRPGSTDARPGDLQIFALAACIIGFYQRGKRWRELNRGVRQHSYYIGTSPFDSPRWPLFFQRNRRVARFIDPVFCAIIGFALAPYSRELAVWLVFSGFCLRSLEYYVHVKRRNVDLDLVDGLIEAERHGQTVEHFENASDPRPQQPATGIPTGLGQDVREHLRRRRTK